jgi:hypothetical protein
MSIPRKESALAAWSTNFNARINAAGAAAMLGLTSAQCTGYTAVHTPFIDAYNAAAVPGARSSSLVAIRNAARDALLVQARQLYAFIQANVDVPDGEKELLGVHVKSAPTPVPVPASFPDVDIVSTVGSEATVRLHDASGDGKRSKPPGVKGASVWSYTGPNPENPALYKWEGCTNRSTFAVQFDPTLTPGTVVYITAMWLNDKNQAGPAAPPATTRIQVPTTLSIAA